MTLNINVHVKYSIATCFHFVNRKVNMLFFHTLYWNKVSFFLNLLHSFYSKRYYFYSLWNAVFYKKNKIVFNILELAWGVWTYIVSYNNRYVILFKCLGFRCCRYYLKSTRNVIEYNLNRKPKKVGVVWYPNV